MFLNFQWNNQNNVFEIPKFKYRILNFSLAKKDFARKVWYGAGVGAGARDKAGSNPADDFIFNFIIIL